MAEISRDNEGKIGYASDANFDSNDILYMLKDLPDACCIFKVLTDPFGTVKDMLFLFANEKYASLVGVPSAELIGTTYFTAVNNNDEDWIKFSYQAAILRQSSINRTYNSHFDKWFEFWAVPVYQKGFCAFIIHDVTAHKINEVNVALKTNTSSFVIDCAKTLSTYGYNKGLKRVVKKLGQTIEADRVFVVKTRRSEIEQVTGWVNASSALHLPEKQIFEDFDFCRMWDEQLQDNAVFTMRDTAVMRDEDPVTYDELVKGNVRNYLIAALRSKNERIGFLVADNYDTESNVNTEEVFESVAVFVSAEMRNFDLTTELMFLSNHDALTGIGNRYALNSMIEMLGEAETSAGICYSDINGLKAVNDTKGHEAGDKIIIETAEVFASVFKKKNCYRIGGDEFIAIVPDVEEAKFREMIEKLKIRTGHISIAIGDVWVDNTSDITEAVKNADQEMYKSKAEFYKNHERRHKNS